MDKYGMFSFIVLVVVIGSIVHAALAARVRRRDHEASDDGEAIRLRDEMKQLKERLAVLERITVEKENSLEREIEKLRDRP